MQTVSGYVNPTIRLTRVAAMAASFVFVTFLVIGSSRAAFTDTTDNTLNTASAGTVSLTDDDLGSVSFSASGMVPGTTVVECITVSYGGDVAAGSPVALYRSGANTGTGLDQYLDLVVEVGTGGVFGDCSGFSASSTLSSGSTLQAFATSYTAFGSSLDTTWTPAGSGENRTFRFTLSLQDDNAAQGLTAGFGFQWEAQS